MTLENLGVLAPRTERWLVPGREIHIIACQRAPSGHDQGRVFGVRWASRPDLGFPVDGYDITRIVGDNRTPLGSFDLPDSTNWATFRADALSRRPVRGPYFPTVREEDLGYLLPIVRLADPRTGSAEWVDLTREVAAFFGETHRNDAALAWHIWRYGEVPPLDDLLADAATRGSIVAHYRKASTDFLIALALRFEYAVLFGLATDDGKPPSDGTVVYEVQARFGHVQGASRSDPARTNERCDPGAPAWLTAERMPGSVGHPAFVDMPPWKFPSELVPVDGAGRPMESKSFEPRVPSAWTALAWAPPPDEPNLIGYGPVLYLVRRYAYGPGTASLPSTPSLPAGAAFEPLVEGDLVVRGDDAPHAVDSPGIAWPPLEGYYAYEVRGVDLLGTVSSQAARATVRHHDDLAPPHPTVRNRSASVLSFDPAAPAVELTLDIGWESGEDFVGPDAVEFRMAATWLGSESVPLQVLEVHDIDLTHGQLVVDRLDGTADAFVGRRISFPSGDHPIESHTTGSRATVDVRKVAGRLPDEGDFGSLLYSAEPTPVTRVAAVERSPVVPARVTVVRSLAPVEVELAAVGGATLPTGTVRMYWHVLRGSVDATSTGSGRWELATPDGADLARSAWDAWMALADPEAAAAGSPVILFPPHQATVTVVPPPDFVSGLLTLKVTAADGTPYVFSPSLPASDPSLTGLRGNESGAVEVFASVRKDSQPVAPGTVPFDATRIIWAESAATFAEDAEYTVSWSTVAGASRYEVRRVMEAALPGANAATSDTDLRTLAAANLDVFDLRSAHIFGTSFRDRIPGRAPTRALYIVQSVDLAGELSDPSGVIGPVYVPDVRPPAAPNLQFVGAMPAAGADRAVRLVWSQAAPHERLAWRAEARPAAAAGDVNEATFTELGELPVGTPPDGAGRFELVIEGRPAGQRFEYRVTAVRKVPDPIDVTGSTLREVAGPPSEIRISSAVSGGPLVQPAALAAASTAAGVELTWTAADHYEALEVRRRTEGRWGMLRLATLPGDATEFVDTTAGPGLWVYVVCATGGGRAAKSGEVTIELMP